MAASVDVVFACLPRVVLWWCCGRCYGYSCRLVNRFVGDGYGAVAVAVGKPRKGWKIHRMDFALQHNEVNILVLGD